MNEDWPKPLSTSLEDPFAKQVLSASSEDVPPARSRAKLLGALAASGVLTIPSAATGTTAATGSALSALGIVKWGIGCAVVLATSYGAYSFATSAPSTVVAKPSAASAPEMNVAAMPTSATPLDAPQASVPVAPTIEDIAPALPSTPKTTARQLPVPLPVPSSVPTFAASPGSAETSSSAPPPAAPSAEPAERKALLLQEEARILARVRERLEAGDTASAKTGIDDYEKRFPSGQLAREKEILKRRIIP